MDTWGNPARLNRNHHAKKNGHSHGPQEYSGSAHPLVIHLPGGGVVHLSSDEPAGKRRASGAERKPKPKEFAGSWIGGTPVELVEDQKNPSRLLFAVPRGLDIELVDHIEEGGSIWVPPARLTAPFRVMHFPTGVAPYDSPERLVSDCGDFLHSICRLSSEERNVFSAQIMHSWTWEKMPFSVCLTLLGPREFTDFLVRAMALLCHRPVIAAGATAGGILRACTGLGATLLVEADGLSKSALAALDAGAWNDAFYLQGGSTLSAFGPKIVAAPENRAGLDDLRGGFSMSLSLLELPRWAMLDDDQVLEDAEELRNRLLRFRFDYIDQMKIPNSARTYVYPKRGMITGVLIAPFSKDPEFCRDLAADLSDIDTESVDRLPTRQASVVAAAFSLAKDPGCLRDGEMLNGEITKVANRILEEQGEAFRLKAREVGAILSGLGFPKRSRDCRGYRVLIDQNILDLIHRLAKLYGVFDPDPYRSRGPRLDCQLCRKYKLVEGVTDLGYKRYEEEEAVRHQKAGLEREARFRRARVRFLNSPVNTEAPKHTLDPGYKHEEQPDILSSDAS